MRRPPLAEYLKVAGTLSPPVGYTPPSSVQELMERAAQGETYFLDSNFSGQKLSEVQFPSVHLSGSDFSGASLYRCTFDQTKLIACKFIGATISECKIKHSLMMGSDFYQAKILDTEVSFSDLRGSFFGIAELAHTTLIGNSLADSLFQGTRIICTPFALNDLGNTQHPGPHSYIDIHSLYLSAHHLRHAAQFEFADEELTIRHRKITEGTEQISQFLAGCGMPTGTLELFLGWLEDRSYQSVFISYSTMNEDFARELDVELRKRGVNVWFAPHDIRGGRMVREQVQQAVKNQSRTILVLSEESMRSGWVETEIRHAFEAANGSVRRLFPIRLVDFDKIKEWTLFDPDSGVDLAHHIRGFFVPDFTNWRDEDSFLRAMEALTRDLREDHVFQNSRGGSR